MCIRDRIGLEQIETRRRRLGHVDGELLGEEGAAALPGIPGGHELREYVLDLPEHEEVGLPIDSRARGRVRPAEDHRLAVFVRQTDDTQRIELLIDHAAGHHHVGPGEIFPGDVFGVAIDEAKIPMRRQHGGDGDQSERRGRVAGAEQLASFREVPERVRLEAWIDQKHVASARGRHFLELLLQRSHTDRRARSMALLPGNTRTKPAIRALVFVVFVKILKARIWAFSP